MKIEVADEAGLGERGADLVLESLGGRPDPVWGVATGGSPLGIYRALAQRTFRAWRGVRAFALDEYVGLAPDDPRSYRSTVERDVVRALGLDPALVHVPDGSAPDPVLAAKRYERDIEQGGGIDVQVLGIGRNGHIGFNEPGTALDEHTHLARLADETRIDNARYFARMSDVPVSALTQGPATIMRSRRIVLIALGRAKAPAIARALTGPVDPVSPASILQRHPDVTVLLDADAASALPE